MPEHPSTLAEQVVAAMLRDDRATVSLGMQVESVSAGASCVTMAVREDMLNGFATCHGGFIFALADSAFAFACNSRNQQTVAAGCQIDYLRPARAGDILRARAMERVAGSRLGLYDVTVTNQQDETVALFRGRSCRVKGTVLDVFREQPTDLPGPNSEQHAQGKIL
jgi:acyl-CoA thioesterase